MLETIEKTKLSFSGHQSFPFRYAWLWKGVHYVGMYEDLFYREDANVILGVDKNMVSSIRHWCETLRLVQGNKKGRHSVSDFGNNIFADFQQELTTA